MKLCEKTTAKQGRLKGAGPEICFEVNGGKAVADKVSNVSSLQGRVRPAAGSRFWSCEILLIIDRKSKTWGEGTAVDA